MANIELTLTPASPTGSMIFTLGAPGPQGIPGPQGPQGPQGDPGEGVPVGGSSGQVLAKVDGVDYNTEWITVNPETSWGEITGTLSNQTDLQDALDAKQSVSGMSEYLTKDGNLSGLADFFTARTNIGLGLGNEVTFFAVNTISGDRQNFLDGNGLQVNDFMTGNTVWVKSDGIRFADNTTQTTAYPGGIEGCLLAANNLSDVTNLLTSRDNLGLGEEQYVRFLGLYTINGVSYNGLDAGGLNVCTNGGQPNESQVWVRSDGIQFPDYTIQTTAYPGSSGFAPIYSPVFTGNPRAPTPATNDNDTSIATTAFVKAQGYITSAPVTSVAGRTGAITLAVADVSGAAPIASPTFTGDPKAPTPATSDNDTSIATTAFVKAQSYLTSSALTPYARLDGATFTGQVNCSLSLILPQDDATPVSVLKGQIWHDGTGVFRVGTDDGTQQILITDNSLSSTLNNYAPLASPALTGNPTAPTPATSDNDTSIATTAFVKAQGLVPAGGTTGQLLAKSSGSNYATTWTTVIPGDRYLTTSTTSNTVSNGTKTFTVGSGLSYTTQQDVTIAADPSNHMHAVVTTYDSVSGVMVVDVKTHTGSGTHVSWTVNVGGTVSLASVAWGDVTGTLSNQTDLQDALDAKLPLAGGAMDANASITASDTSTASDSEVAGWGLGVQLSADHTKGTTVEFDGLDAYDGASHMQVTPTGITFPDATTQTTAGIEEAPMDNKPYVRFNGVWMVPPYNYVGSITMIGTDIVNTSSWYGAPFYLGRNGNVIANSEEFGNELYIGGSSGYDKSSSTYPYLNQLTLCSNFGFDHSLATNPPNIDGWNSLRNIAMTYNSFVTAPNCGGFDLLTLVLDQNEYMATAPYFTNTSSLYQVSMLGCSVSSSELLSCLSQIYNLGGAANNGYFDCSGGNNGALDPSAIEITQLQDAGWTITFNSI